MLTVAELAHNVAGASDGLPKGAGWQQSTDSHSMFSTSLP